jgi:hypothetical protein
MQITKMFHISRNLLSSVNNFVNTAILIQKIMGNHGVLRCTNRSRFRTGAKPP